MLIGHGSREDFKLYYLPLHPERKDDFVVKCVNTCVGVNWVETRKVASFEAVLMDEDH